MTIDLDKLEALARAATPGPWKHYVDQGCNVVLKSGKVFLPTLRISPENCAYIAAANPAVILKLVAELRKVRADACEWIDIARWLAQEMGGGAIPEIQWLTIARQAVKEKLDAAKEATCPKN